MFLFLFEIMGRMAKLKMSFFIILLAVSTLQEVNSHGDQPLSKIAIHKTVFALSHNAYVKATPPVLGLTVKLLNTILNFNSLSFLVLSNTLRLKCGFISNLTIVFTLCHFQIAFYIMLVTVVLN